VSQFHQRQFQQQGQQQAGHSDNNQGHGNNPHYNLENGIQANPNEANVAEQVPIMHVSHPQCTEQSNSFQSEQDGHIIDINPFSTQAYLK
jgi:hypothetical protein